MRENSTWYVKILEEEPNILLSSIALVIKQQAAVSGIQNQTSSYKIYLEGWIGIY